MILWEKKVILEKRFALKKKRNEWRLRLSESTRSGPAGRGTHSLLENPSAGSHRAKGCQREASPTDLFGKAA